MAKILDTSPSWMKKENKSVFDSTPKKIARKAMEWAGLDTPKGQIETAVSPAPLVSIFKNKIAREAGTKLFKEAGNQFKPAMKDAINSFARDYPRIAAHIKPEAVQMPKGIYASTMGPRGKVEKAIPIGYNVNESNFLNNMNDARNTVYHEGTHAAQALGNKDFDRLYGNAEKLVGYHNNPFEKQARKAGLRSVKGNSGNSAGNAIEGLREIVSGKIPVHLQGNTGAINSIEGTLRRRSYTNPSYEEMIKSTTKPKVETGPSPEELRKFLDDEEPTWRGVNKSNRKSK